MNKTLIVLAGGALLLSCCGCTSDVSSESDADNPQTTVTSSTAATESENAVSTSDTTNTDIVTNPDSQPDVTEAVTMFQGGIGDEQTAETPKPEFFVYRFQPDGFAVRLAGGTYQIVSCDLSAAFDHRIDEEYYLDDFDHDGDFDLYIPASYDDDAHVLSYYLFCWNADEEKFLSDPQIVQAES